jgi:hypothetical protein
MDNKEKEKEKDAPGLKSFRYEDVQVGLPPRKGLGISNKHCAVVKQDAPRPSLGRRQSSVTSFSSSIVRPKTSPVECPRPFDSKSPIFADLKRDSGIAPSVSTITTTATTPVVEHRRLPSQTAVRSPILPTIVVHDEAAATSRFIDRGRAPTTNKKTHKKLVRRSRSISPSELKAMAGFRGLHPTVLPAPSSSDDFTLEDLASNKLGFSTRGSLLFGGKKMQELINAQGDDHTPSEPVTSTAAIDSPERPFVSEDHPVSNHVEEEHHLSGTETPSNGHLTPTIVKRQGLVTGRRQPSVHMLQAALNGGRVLSAEEITFSMKVRTMYEHGDERAADWTSPSNQPNYFAQDPANDGDLDGKARRDDDRWPTADNRLSYISKYSRTSNELAGGIEDWDNVDGHDVDRYGFIHENRAVSRASNYSTHVGHGMQRIATALRVEGAQPRRDRRFLRSLSTKRSTRSMPQHTDAECARSFKKGPGSIHSVKTTTSRVPPMPFWSKTKRYLAEAPDMLTLPPSLEDIEEFDDAGKTASALKQREWAREDKWRHMAKAVQRRNEGKGGGMHFEFDTTDPKLIERAWKGIPDRWRATAWHSFLSESARKRNSSTTDEELIGQFHKLQEMSCADDVQIDVDVPRTVQLHIMFRRRYRGGQRLLFRVLHAMALYFPEVGYVQGMASIAVTLLCYYDEEKAFVMMVRLWQLRGLESFFKEDFAGLMAALGEFEQDWLAGDEVAEKLTDLGITSTTYGTRWYLTLFNMSVPFPAQLRVWDVFMLLGDAPMVDGTNEVASTNAYAGADLDVLHATSAALIDATREVILDSDFETAMKVLTSFILIKDEDVLMRVARTEYKIKKKRTAAHKGKA